MENLNISHQTLQQFLDAPFGVSNNNKKLKYEDRYRNFRDRKEIQVVASIEVDKNYFVHLKVPSESKNGDISYDVVIQFFTPDEEIEKELTVDNYYVQFFSNSPGFVYKYAALYKLQGYLIESLTDKYDVVGLNTLPDKSNSDYELSYDSSIFYACRYLLEKRFFSLGKLSMKIFGRKSVSKFFEDVQASDSINANKKSTNIEKSVRQEISKDMKLSKSDEDKLKHSSFGKLYRKELHEKDKRESKKSSTSTFKDKSTASKVVSGKSHTGKSSSITRKSGTKSTYKKK